MLHYRCSFLYTLIVYVCWNPLDDETNVYFNITITHAPPRNGLHHTCIRSPSTKAAGGAAGASGAMMTCAPIPNDGTVGTNGAGDHGTGGTNGSDAPVGGAWWKGAWAGWAGYSLPTPTRPRMLACVTTIASPYVFPCTVALAFTSRWAFTTASATFACFSAATSAGATVAGTWSMGVVEWASATKNTHAPSWGILHFGLRVPTP